MERTHTDDRQPGRTAAGSCLLALLFCLAGAPAAAQLQPCLPESNCVQVSAAAPESVVRFEPFAVALAFAPGEEDGTAGGLDDIAALTFSFGVPGLELAVCDSPTEDGLTAAISVAPEIAAKFRVIIENTTCNDDPARPCLCPGTGQTRAPYVNVAVFGPKAAEGQDPDDLPTLPAGEFLTLSLRAGSGAAASVPLHVFAATDGDATPKPTFGARVSVGDTTGVDVSVSGADSRIRTIDDVVAVLEPPTPTLTATPTLTSTPTPTATPTSSATPSVTETATATAPPTETAPPTSTATQTLTPVSGLPTSTFTPTLAQSTPSATPEVPTGTVTPQATATATAAAVEPTATAAEATATPTAPAVCPGDCDGNGEVSVEERLIGVRIALLELPRSQCIAADVDGDLSVTIEELVAATEASIDGCD